MNVIMTRLLPPKLTVEECYNKAIKTLEDESRSMKLYMRFADGVFWGVGRPDMIRIISDRDDLKCTLTDIWEHWDGSDKPLKRAFILICKEIAWELDPWDPVKGEDI